MSKGRKSQRGKRKGAARSSPRPEKSVRGGAKGVVGDLGAGHVEGNPPQVRMSPTRILGFLALVALLAVAYLAVSTLIFPSTGALTISYPFDGSVFPPEIVAPTVWWEDGESTANRWRISVEFEGGGGGIEVEVDTTVWAPSQDLWKTIKARTVGEEARISVTGLASLAGLTRTLSSHTISISTSSDSVGAAIFFREVPLPFLFATANLPMMKWRLGDIGSSEPPPIILENLPSCGNCHSFSAVGATLGMDVDVANDKGAYVLTPFEEETVLSREKIFSWNDYYPPGGSVRTFGLLARVSPDGRYVVGGMKDRAVFIPRPDLEYSQLFFPVQGLLSYFDQGAHVLVTNGESLRSEG